MNKTPAGFNANRRFSQPVGLGGAERGGRRSSDLGHVLPRTIESSVPMGNFDVDKGRKGRGKDASDPTTFDAEHYNPDGSLRTVHKMPSFTEAYAQASQARYIRHKSPTDREKELSVNEVFDRPPKK